jgi:hypothetical protein
MPEHQAAMERTWIVKMTERARRGATDPHDLEAHYRRHWLLKDLLEYSFTLRNRWYCGPKAALAALQREEPALYTLFSTALLPGASLGSLEALASAVAALRP